MGLSLPPPSLNTTAAMVCPLDGFPALTAGAAYSVNERLLTSYSGPLFTVRRASDNTTQNIGFDSKGHCDEVSLIAFCGSAIGYVTTLYDQSGYARNLTQATATDQPTVFDGAAVIKDGLNVAMLFGIGTSALGRTDALGLVGSPALSVVSLHNGRSALGAICTFGPNTFLGSIYLAGNSGNLTVGSPGSTSAVYGAASGAAQAYLLATRVSGGTTDQFVMRENAIARPLTSSGNVAASILNTSFTLGNYATGGQRVGSLSTLVVLPYVVTTAQQTALEAWLEARRAGTVWTATFAASAFVTGDKAKLDTVLNAAMVCPLDGMPAMSTGGAFSVNERLLSSYTGPLFTVRRASDNATLDVYWDVRGHCDEAALVAFCGATVGSVATLYDQSGYGRHATQATAANQPTVYNGTVVQKDGSNVSLLFVSNQQLTRTDALGFAGSPVLTVLSLHNFGNASAGFRAIFNLGPEVNGQSLYLNYSSGSSNTLALGTWNLDAACYGVASLVPAYLLLQHVSTANVSSLSVRETGVSKAYTNVNAGAATNGFAIVNTNLSLGGLGSGAYPVGTLSTAVFLPYTLTSQQQTALEAWLEARRTGVEWTAQLTRFAAVTEPTRVYPLDAFAGSIASAWSVAERVVATWAGPLFNVRRASDNTTKDIGYDSAGTCDTATLAAFCSGTSGFVTKVYDQSGNARDISQATAANQPTIYASGAVQRDGANVSMLFGSTTSVLSRSDALGFAGSPAFTALSLHNFGASAASLRVVYDLGPGGPSDSYLAYDSSGLGFGIGGQTQAQYGTASTALSYVVAQGAAAALPTGLVVRQNGIAKTWTATLYGATIPYNIANTGMTVGGFSTAGFQLGSLSTLCFLTTTITTVQLAAVEAWLEARRTSQPWQGNAGSGIGRIATQAVDIVPLSVSYASVIALDISQRAYQNIAKLTGNTTLNILNAAIGSQGRITTQQDTTGGWSVAWVAPAGWTLQWVGSQLVSTAAGTTTVYEYQCQVQAGVNTILMQPITGGINEVLPTGCPLDAVNLAPSAAWSVVERLRTAYAGPACNVRRSSDNATADIGFVSSTGRLDTVALLAFCGSGSGYVTALYDQSGNGRHLTQATTANQPTIVASGVVQKDGANVSMLFSGAQVLTRSDSCGFIGNPAFTVVSLHNFGTSGATARGVWGFGAESAGNIAYLAYLSGSIDMGEWGGSSDALYGSASTAAAYIVAQHAAGVSNTGLTVRENGAIKAFASGPSVNYAISNTETVVGGFTTASNPAGSVSTVVLFPATLTTPQLTTLESWLEARRAGTIFTATVPLAAIAPIVTVSGVIPTLGPLDGLAAAAGAYSVAERLRVGYGGYACNVRRASDNATLDIGFGTDGKLDEAALVAFCGASIGYVTTLYDQSGNSRNLTQATTTDQPVIYNGSVVQKDGSNVSMLFTGTQRFTRADACGFSGSPAFTAVSLHNLGAATGSNRVIYNLGPETFQSNFNVSYASDNANTLALGTWNATTPRYGVAATALAYLVVQHSASANMSSFVVRENAASKPYTNVTLGSATDVVAISNTAMSLGGQANGSFPVGTLSTFVLLPYTLTTAQLAQLEGWLESRRVGTPYAVAVPLPAVDLLLPSPLAVPYAATATLDLARRSDFVIGPLTGNVTVAFTNPIHGRRGRIWLMQDATGGRTISWSGPSGWTLKTLAFIANSTSTSVSAFSVYDYQCVTIGTTNYILVNSVAWGT